MRRSSDLPLRLLAGLALSLGTSMVAAPTHAQLDRPTAPMALPGYSLTAPDVPEAVDLNPSAIAFLPSWGFAYVHSDSGDDDRFTRGDGFYAASPLLFGIAAGLSVDSVRPSPLSREDERTMISLALAYGMEDALSVGAAVRFLASGDVRLNGVTTLDLAASWRPVDWLAMSFIARDVVGPRLGGTLQSVPRSFLLGVGLRPFGSRALGLDVAGAIDETGRIGGRLAAELPIPFVGRLLAAAEAQGLDGDTPEVRVVSGLALDWDMISAGGGVWLGDGISDAPGWYVSGHLQGAERDGIPSSRVVLDITIGGVGPRGLVAIERRLERALTDDRVAGVLLRPRGSGMGLAYAQEIRLLVDQLREAGKPVVCHLDDATGAEWYACAGATRVLVDPAGGVRLAGVSSELYHLGDLLRNVGIRADFVRIGENKSAIEAYMNPGQTGPARRQRERTLDLAYRRLVFDGAHDRGMDEARFRHVIDDGPHLPEGAVSSGLANALADESDMDAELREAFGDGYPRETGERWEMPDRWGHRPRIGVVVIDDTIVDGDNVDIPLIGIHASGGRTISRAIDRLAADASVVAIVLRVDSPGGSVMASDQIYRAVVRARRRKPVIASFGAVAASGGYYVAAPANEIWADPSTITGSIGIWFGKVDFAPLGRMIGVELEQMGRGAHSGATSLYRPFTPEERAVLAGHVRHWYRAFLRRVARGRGMTVREVDSIARGRIWMGDEAIHNGLVDHLGGFTSALAAARRAAGVGPEVDIVVVPDRPSTLLDYALAAIGIGAAPNDPLAAESQSVALGRVAPELRVALGTVVTLQHLGSSAPMALMPEVAVPQ